MTFQGFFFLNIRFYANIFKLCGGVEKTELSYDDSKNKL